MKFEGICFPHPVLGRYDDVTGEYSVTDPIYEGGESSSRITVEHELFSPVIAEQLKKENVAFATELHCKNTGYRETFICNQKNTTKATQSIEVPKGRLRGIIDTTALIVATRSFRYAYHNSWNDDYKGKTFPIRRGMPLTIGVEGKIDIPEQNDGKKGGQSFIRIQVDESIKSGPFKVMMGDDPLVVVLARKDFESYARLSRRKANSSIFISSIALPAISYAIANMYSNAGDSSKDCKWYQAIEAKMQTNPELANLEKNEFHSIQAAQIILKSPFGEMLNEMIKVEDKVGLGDD
jgi:hypothetical protein